MEQIWEKIRYLLIWRNDRVLHQFSIHEGHPAENDARKSIKKTSIWLLTDLKKNN